WRSSGSRSLVPYTTRFRSDRFALRAFEVHAVDYLLKPFDRERFQTALRRALDHIKHAQSGELSQRLSALLAEVKPAAKHLERLRSEEHTSELQSRSDLVCR